MAWLTGWSAPWDVRLLARLSEIPGVGPGSAAVIIAEIGVDMGVFPIPGHLASWAKLTPRTVQSGAKNRHSGTPESGLTCVHFQIRRNGTVP